MKLCINCIHSKASSSKSDATYQCTRPLPPSPVTGKQRQRSESCESQRMEGGRMPSHCGSEGYYYVEAKK